MSSNETNRTNATVYYSHDYNTVYYIVSTFEIFLVVTGTLLNAWFLVAILRSSQMRSSLRNKIICNSLVLNLAETLIYLPVFLTVYMSDMSYTCTLYSVLSNLRLVQDFIGNWLLVMLIIVFIAQIQDFNPRMKLTPRAVTVSTIGLLVFPWISSIVVVSIIIQEFYFRFRYARVGCLYATYGALEVLKSVDTAVPIILAVILLVLSAFLKYRRLHRGHSSESIQIELISRDLKIDNTFVYVAAVLVATTCDILQFINYVNRRAFSHYGETTWMILILLARFISDARVILMPLPWLLLTDVRQTIKTWRPWYRPADGIDLTVTYSKEDN
uniref:G-protein coupled receptors family 1 profile domain-containing protein n=2 Tax=Arion vulgaris TaxID=1028688 RepID=A0A0B7BJJ9_9EUPU